ncbi:MAG: transcriptional regulator [Planctomycetota bacterium]
MVSTDATTQPADPIPEAVLEARERFVAAWGQMGSAWGISRTMAEVHALLFITGEALCTDDFMSRLSISRGNASMSLRALLEWGVISRTHKRGDRKEYFEAESDVWALFRSIVRERMKREVEPLVAGLYDLRTLTHGDSGKRANRPDAVTAAHNERLDDMLEFFATMEKLSQRFVSPSGRGLETAAKLLSRL